MFDLASGDHIIFHPEISGEKQKARKGLLLQRWVVVRLQTFSLRQHNILTFIKCLFSPILDRT